MEVALFKPTIGQILFGNPTSELDCPEFVEAGLTHLAHEIERVEWNNTQQEYKAPTGNNGGHYVTDAFEMHAYYWGECDCAEDHRHDCPTIRPNFKCGEFEVRWYKYCGRGMSMN